jgi:transglutaminase-like putative cysteine protease
MFCNFFSRISIVLLFTTSFLFAQKSDYSTLTISDSLKENANAIVRLNQIDIVIASQRSMNVKTKRVVTVLNEKGQSSVDAFEGYDKRERVENIQATVLDAFGNEIKKIKRKDFKDQSSVDGGTLFSDGRVVYLDYTPIQYPYTIVYESDIETSTTAFVPQWLPLNDYFLSVEKSVLNVSFPENLGFRKRELNFSNLKIKKTIETSTQLSYTATNILAQKYEDYSPNISRIFPRVMMGLEFFNLEGVDGNAKTWKEFGKWWSDKILTGTEELPEETKVKIKALVGDEKDPIKKAKLIYKYVQEKSRYVAISEGIGGWKPMPVKDVDRLGYGDCKALSNYTKALLNAVDVPSYYTKLYGSSDKQNIESDFVSQQGNHIILTIPNGNDYVFLECTSQDDPFGYQANFTDDRDVLVIKPDGGEIIRTKNYENKDNAQISKGIYSLDENGKFSGKISMVSEGSQYGQKARVEKMQPTDREEYYKDFWDNISNLKINKAFFSNDKEKVSFSENMEISAENYGKISNGKLIFAVNAFDQYTGSVKRIRNRKNPFEIQRGSVDIDEIEIALPANFSIEFLPGNVEINGKFGEYKTEIVKKDNNNIIYKRKFFLKKGLYTNKEYDEFRIFMEQISRNDNAKIILTKS